jgi:hypothetical protein
MNAAMVTNGKGSSLSNCLKWILVAGLALCASACATNQQQTKGTPDVSGFLGDYSDMQVGEKDRANLYYEKPDVDWSKYTMVWIKPVELWKSDDPDSPMGKISPEDQQKLIDLTYTDLNNALSPDYTIVDHGGPGVLIIRAAITDAKPSKPVAGAVSSIYLPLKLASLGKQSLTGTAIGVGSITIEAELLDGQTNERLVALVDSRSGTSALRSKANGTWGDVNESLEYWAKRLKTRLAEERANAPTKTAL